MRVLLLFLIFFAFVRPAFAQPREEVAPTVGVKVSDLSEKDFEAIDALTLLRRLVLRLAEEGFSVTQPESSPAIAINVERQNETVVLTMAVGDYRDTTQVEGTGLSVEALHLAVEHAVVELARDGATRIPQPEPDVPVPEEPLPIPTETNLLVLLGGGGQFWGQTITPSATFDARFGSPSLRGGVRLNATAGEVDQLSLQEYGVAAVGEFVVPTFSSGELAIGIAGGALLHRFDFGASGTRVSPTVALSLDHRFLFGPFVAALYVSPTFVFSKYVHLDGSAVIFDATFFRFPASVQFGWMF